MISMLIIQSIWDWRFQQIPIAVTIVGGMVGAFVSIIEKRTPMSVCMALLPGVLCLLIGWFTKEAIGYGDGFLLCAMGMYISCGEVFAILMLASVLASIVGLGLLIFEGKKGRDQIPFVPFLLVASVVHLLIGEG